MKAVTLSQTNAPETNARGTLTGGIACLALGIALVGVGADHEGAVLVLAGMALTIFGLHSFGRLGPLRPLDADDAEPDGVLGDRPQNVGRGVVLAAAGGAVLVGGAPSDLGQVLACVAILAGGALLWRGARGRRASAGGPGDDGTTRGGAAPKRRIEKKRRMEKSAAP